jgi:hypothetical protein
LLYYTISLTLAPKNVVYLRAPANHKIGDLIFEYLVKFGSHFKKATHGSAGAHVELLEGKKTRGLIYRVTVPKDLLKILLN